MSTSWCFYDCVYRGISEKSIVSHLYICAPERDILRFCHLVDPLPVSVGSAVGSDHAVTKTDSGEASSACLYAAVCCPWLFIRNFVCTGAGTAVRFKLSENGCLDHQWAAWDFVHGVSNFFCGILIVPIVKILTFLEKNL